MIKIKRRKIEKKNQEILLPFLRVKSQNLKRHNTMILQRMAFYNNHYYCHCVYFFNRRVKAYEFPV